MVAADDVKVFFLQRDVHNSISTSEVMYPNIDDEGRIRLLAGRLLLTNGIRIGSSVMSNGIVLNHHSLPFASRKRMQMKDYWLSLLFLRSAELLG
ncbi:DUF3696 domain-containing protein [Escherichia coli]